MELAFAIKKNIAANKLIKLVGKYRQAQLSMLKAKMHHYKENEYQEKPNNIKFEKLEELIIKWTDKTNDDIINEVKKSNNLLS